MQINTQFSFLLLLASVVLMVSPSSLKLTSNIRSGRTTDTDNSDISRWWEQVSTSYPKYNDTTTLLDEMEEKYPNLVKIYSVGQSVQEREMWMINLRSDANEWRNPLQPPVKIVANIHGDEALGRALVLMLAVDLIKRYNENDPRVVRLMNTTDIHLMPSINPDGFEAAVEGVCNPDPTKFGRLNAHNVDLNRNFPDQFLDDHSDREPETLSMMEFIHTGDFVLSVSLHSGAVAASYPFDSVPAAVEKTGDYRGSGVASLTSDNDIFVYLAKLYADNHKTMKSANHPECVNSSLYFPSEGITNAAQWNNNRGGMQDYNYLYSNCFEITIELSCCKYPPSGELLKEWDNNKESLYKLLESVHMGVRGFVLDESENEMKGKKVEVTGHEHPVYVNGDGEYWRLLLPGSYSVGPDNENMMHEIIYAAEVEVGPLNLDHPTVVNFTVVDVTKK